MGLGSGIGISRQFRSGAFAPSDLSGLQLWLDGNEGLNTKTAAKFTTADSDFLNSASTDFDKGNENFSFGGWIYLNGSQSNNIWGKWVNPTNQSFILWADESVTGKWRGFISGDGSTNTEVQSTVNITLNTWNFVYMVYDADNDLIKMSVNGAAFDTSAHSTGAYSASTADFNISGINTQYFEGRIDDFTFYDKALTLAQVQALYNSGSGVNYSNFTADQLTNLVSFYDFNELSGNRSDSHGSNTLTDNNSVGFAEGIVLDENIADGDAVHTWFDQSTTNTNATQTTAVDQPIYRATGLNSKPSVDPDGSTDFLTIGQPASLDFTASNYTMFLVADLGVTPAGNEVLFSTSNGGGLAGISMRYTSGGDVQCFHIERGSSEGGLILNNITSSSSHDSSSLIIALTFENGVGSELFINNVSDGTDNTATGFLVSYTLDWRIFARDFTTPFFTASEISEIVVYNSLLSSGDRTSVHNYLSAKWGI